MEYFIRVVLGLTIIFSAYLWMRVTAKEIVKCNRYKKMIKNCDSPEQLDSIFEYFKRLTFLPNKYSEECYKEALLLLETYPEWTSARVFVVNVGRWHFGKSNKDSIVSDKDERTIQTDIIARTSTLISNR
ncbi:hypothetical protein [Chamaesiphon sp.]|uniref:hypothetical protein n=1 Tax=Chamaesiphon sp. TaxID=2814140 RepID=UPI0035945C76